MSRQGRGLATKSEDTSRQHRHPCMECDDGVLVDDGSDCAEMDGEPSLCDRCVGRLNATPHPQED